MKGLLKYLYSCCLIISLAALLLLLSENAFSANIQFISYSYQHNFKYGQTFNITVTVKNNGSSISNAYFSPVLTNSSTNAEVYPTGSAAKATFANGETATFVTRGWTTMPPTGKYTVTLILYNGSDVEIGRKSGVFPVRIGATGTLETLKVFPATINLGVLPYGRHMYPVPLEITYDFFLFNRLGEQKPWYIRIYTDNYTKYKGIQDAVRRGSPAGLVSSDGQYTIPLRVWCLNFPPEDQELGWDSLLSGAPPVDDDTYWNGPLLDSGERNYSKAAWLRIPDYSEMTADRGTWRNLIGQDFYDSQFKTDTNQTGDFTLKNPFSAFFATETNPTSVTGTYSTSLIVELYSP